MDEQIRDKILEILHESYRNPKGRNLRMTAPVIERRVKDALSCNREDVLRELNYLLKKNLVDERKERYSSYKIGNNKISGGTTVFYELSSKGIDLFETPSKYANIKVMITRHTVKIFKSKDGYKSTYTYNGDFQPDMCFLPIDANVEAEDKIQLLDGNNVRDEKVVGEVKKYFGGYSEHIEVLWKTKSTSHPDNVVSISHSSIYAPITAGVGNIVHSLTFTPSSDIDKILQFISDKQDLDEPSKEKLKNLIKSELPLLLKNPDINKTKGITDKLKSIGQDWIIPVVTQVVATYFSHSLGINQ